MLTLQPKVNFGAVAIVLLFSAGCGKSDLAPPDAESADPITVSDSLSDSQQQSSAHINGAPTASPIREEAKGLAKGFQATSAMVLVGLHRGGESFYYPAFVSKVEDGKAYVCVRFSQRDMAYDKKHYGLSPANSSDTFSIHWGNDNDLKEVPATLIASYFNYRWILTAPAELMPQPLAALHQRTMEVGSHVQLISYGPSSEGQKLPPKKIIISGTIHEVLPPAGDGIERFVVNREPGEELYEYAAFSAEGFLLGHTMINKRPGFSAQEGKCFVLGSLIPQIRGDEMLPDIGSAFVDLIGTSEGEVDFRFAVRVDDPLHLLGENVTKELAVEFNGHPSYIQPGTPSKFGPYRLQMKNPQVVPLNSGKLDKEALENIKLVRGYPGDDFLLAEVSEKLSRAPNACSFYLQLVLRDEKSGEVIYGRPLRIIYDKNLIKQKPVQIAAKQEAKPTSPVPKPTPPVSKPAPLVSKQALTVPILKPDENGEIKLTSGATRWTMKETVSDNMWPKPENPSADEPASRLATEEELSKLDALVLDLPDKSFSTTDKRGAFSADGKSIYLLDQFGNLRKLLTADLSCQRILKIPFDVREVEHMGKVLEFPIPEDRQLVLTHAGLVVSFSKKNKLWVIHPETLEVLREIPVDSPSVICGNLTTGNGVCMGRMNPSKNYGERSHALYVIDFGTGKVLHGICLMDYSTRKNLKIPTKHGDRNVMDFRRKLEMSMDGKILMAGGGDGIVAFRMDDGELFFESTTLPKEVTSFSYLGLSTNGEFAVGTLAQKGYVPIIFKANDLETPYFTIPSEQLRTGFQSVCHDSQQHAFYFINTNLIMALQLDSKKHTSYRSQLNTLFSFASPAGGKIAVCGPKSFAVIHLPGSSPIE